MLVDSTKLNLAETIQYPVSSDEYRVSSIIMTELRQNNPIRCTWCGQMTIIIWVHGHGQCRICRTNIDECCRGERQSGGCQDKNLYNNQEY